jgi:hypothetical protein
LEPQHGSLIHLFNAMRLSALPSFRRRLLYRNTYLVAQLSQHFWKSCAGHSRQKSEHIAPGFATKTVEHLFGGAD